MECVGGGCHREDVYNGEGDHLGDLQRGDQRRDRLADHGEPLFVEGRRQKVVCVHRRVDAKVQRSDPEPRGVVVRDGEPAEVGGGQVVVPVQEYEVLLHQHLQDCVEELRDLGEHEEAAGGGGPVWFSLMLVAGAGEQERREDMRRRSGGRPEVASRQCGPGPEVHVGVVQLDGLGQRADRVSPAVAHGIVDQAAHAVIGPHRREHGQRQVPEREHRTERQRRQVRHDHRAACNHAQGVRAPCRAVDAERQELLRSSRSAHLVTDQRWRAMAARGSCAGVLWRATGFPATDRGRR